MSDRYLIVTTEIYYKEKEFSKNNDPSIKYDLDKLKEEQKELKNKLERW